MMNASRLNPELTGISKNLWALLMYLSVFLVWNIYKSVPSKVVYALRGIGIAGLIILALVFSSGTSDNPDWLTTGWWGILGLIGWAIL